MRIENDITMLTPAEADYLERICMFRGEDSQATALKWRIRGAELDWLLEALPPEITQVQRCENVYPYLKGYAMRKYGDSDEEVIKVGLSELELSILHIFALQDVSLILATGGTFGPENSLEAVNDFLQELDLDDERVTQDQLEAMNSSLFEADLRRMAIGNSIIATLTARQ